jgi:HSP20 family protein
MWTRVHVATQPTEISDFSDEVRLLFLELGRSFGTDSLSGECSPAIDVYETDDALEIAADLPGVTAQALRIIGKGDSVLIIGEKPARRTRGESSFHLVERGYGRFARVIRLSLACDASKARATLVNGELRITIPKVAERRGRAIHISVNS